MQNNRNKQRAPLPYLLSWTACGTREETISRPLFELDRAEVSEEPSPGMLSRGIPEWRPTYMIENEVR